VCHGRIFIDLVRMGGILILCVFEYLYLDGCETQLSRREISMDREVDSRHFDRCPIDIFHCRRCRTFLPGRFGLLSFDFHENLRSFCQWGFARVPWREAEDDVEQAVGMRLLIQSAKKQKLKEVAQQLGLYLFSCWFGYIVLVIWMIIYFDTGNLNYPLMSTYH